MGPHLQPELNQRSLQCNLIPMEERSMRQREARMLMTCLLGVSVCERVPFYVYLIKWEIKEWTTISLVLEERGSFD